jgi:hypothetical protein
MATTDAHPAYAQGEAALEVLLEVRDHVPDMGTRARRYDALGSVLRAWDRLDHDDPAWSAVGELASEHPLDADLYAAIVGLVAACSDAHGEGYPDEPRTMRLGTYARMRSAYTAIGEALDGMLDPGDPKARTRPRRADAARSRRLHQPPRLPSDGRRGPMTERRSLTVDGDRLDEGIRQLEAAIDDPQKPGGRLDPRHSRDILIKDIIRRYDDLPAEHPAWRAAADLLTMDESAPTDGRPHDAEDAARAQRGLAELVSVVWDALSDMGAPYPEILRRAKEASALSDALVDELVVERMRED